MEGRIVTNQQAQDLQGVFFDADTFFSKINTSQFNLVWEECHEADEKNKFDYCIQKWIRN